MPLIQTYFRKGEQIRLNVKVYVKTATLGQNIWGCIGHDPKNRVTGTAVGTIAPFADYDNTSQLQAHLPFKILDL